MNELVSARPTALMLTALPVEMMAVLAHVNDPASIMVGPVLCEVGGFDASNGLSWQVVAAELGPGSVDTATAVVKLTTALRPDVLMFVGIAGSLKDDVQVGDVVAATSIVWTERGKVSEPGYLPRVQTVSLSYVLSQWARKVAREGNWTCRLQHPRDGAKAHVAQIASGEKVVAASDYRAVLRTGFSDAFAIETEGFGLARSAEVYADADACVVRGISDLADGTKDDDGQPMAAEAAAAFAFELLDAYSGAQATAAKSAAPQGVDGVSVAAEFATKSSDLEALAEDLVRDVDMLDDDRDQVEDLARELTQRNEAPALAKLLAQTGLALQQGVSPLIGRRLHWLGRQLLRSAADRLSEWQLEDAAKAAPLGMALLLTEPTIWARCPAAARRRCLTALLGPPDNPHSPDGQAIELLAPLLGVGALDEAEAERIRSSFDLAEFEFLMAHGVNLDMLVPRILADLDSGEFGRQNVAARFVYRLPSADGESLAPALDVDLGAAIVRAATGVSHSFGAAEALALRYLSKWPRARLSGGIWAALTYNDGKWFRAPTSDHLPKLVAAAAGQDLLAEVLDEARKLLQGSVERNTMNSPAYAAKEVVILAANYRATDKTVLVSFAEWLESTYGTNL